jgi:CheY-like chemotaxis protein
MDEDVLKGKTLLVVDDETDLRDIVASELEFMGARVFQAGNISLAQEILSKNHIDLIISDIRMPGGTGIDLLDNIKHKDVNDPPIILITGFADITVEKAFHKGAEALMNKPFKLDDLIKMAVRYTTSQKERMTGQNIEATQRIEQKVDKADFKVGRGGVSLKLTEAHKKIEIGEALNFDFAMGERHYTGTAICRWYKATDNPEQRPQVGLEFLKLNPETYEHFQKIWSDEKPIPFIPSLD